MMLNVELPAGRAAAMPSISYPIEPGEVKIHGPSRPGAQTADSMVVQNQGDECRCGQERPKAGECVGPETQPCGDQKEGGQPQAQAPDTRVRSLELHEERFALAKPLFILLCGRHGIVWHVPPAIFAGPVAKAPPSSRP
jgi:hypothetical protein